ncbi:MAG: sigma 54-interacting transcriptional regulator [Desulfobacterales bacterium]|nr:MAG: sigma 54-interacting transcriptional regulator [Desulfobacterales bacterium]
MTARKARTKKISDSSRVEHTEIILESISDGVFTVNREWQITSFNRAAEEITSIRRQEAIGKRCSEVFRASMCEVDCALRYTLETGKPVINRAGFIVNAEGRRIPISVSTALLRDASGQVVGGAETFRDLSEVEELRKELQGRFQVGDLVSRSPAMRKIFDVLPALAASESAVLIQGETGTGKELVARAIHSLSRRCEGPFVAVNCGALPDTLLESELFGYKAGAFTGALKDKPGRFALAEAGTLFLDEIAEVSPALQVRLLRVLQDKTFEPLGATTSVTADARIIAATNQDLAALVKAGTFRPDLFYRIHVVRLDLPPLRRRKEDIPLLVEHFVARFNRRQRKSIAGVSPAVMAVFMGHDWPGNVRELENNIEHAFILCTGDRIEPQHLPEDFIAPLARGDHAPNLALTKKNVEAQAIREALRRNRNNRLAAARELGIHKSTLFRKMKALGMAFPAQDGRSRSRPN